jgi:flagellar protein FliS
MYANQYQQYRQTQAETADPGELVVMLYQGAIRFLQRAALAIRQKDYETANTSIGRAEEIVAELSASLNAGGGTLAENLGKIYDFAYWRLVKANCEKDVEGVEEVLGILRDLLPAWQEAARIARQSRAARPSSVVKLSLAGAI